MKKLLIVEDDPMLVEIYQKKFSQDNSFEVLISSSGLDAERKILNEKPDFVLLDLVLPERDGFEILEKIRKEKDLDKTKIIIFLFFPIFLNLKKEIEPKNLERMALLLNLKIHLSKLLIRSRSLPKNLKNSKLSRIIFFVGVDNGDLYFGFK